MTAARSNTLRLVTGSGALFAAAGLQMVFFLATAKILKPTEFGYLSAVWAYALPVSELVGLGAADYLIQRVSRHAPLFPLMFGGAIGAILLTAPIVVPLVVLLRFVLPGAVHLGTIALLCAAELVLMRLVNLAEQSMIAHGEIAFANLQRVFVAATRLGAIAVLWAVSWNGLRDFAAAYVAVTGVTALVTLGFVTARYGRPRWRRGAAVITRPSFAVHNLGRAMALSIDRMSLSLVLPFDALGVYAAGSRVLQVGTIPVLALFRDTYGGFFRAGRRGIQGAVDYLHSIGRRALLVAGGSTLAAVVFALLMPLLLGPRYAAAMPVGLIIAFSTLAIAAQYAAGDVLTGSDRQAVRARMTLAGLAVAVPLMVAGAWAFGVIGAAIANVTVQAVTALALLWAIRRELRRGA